MFRAHAGAILREQCQYLAKITFMVWAVLSKRTWSVLWRYAGCNRRNGPDFGRVFLMLNYTEKPENTYIQS